MQIESYKTRTDNQLLAIRQHTLTRLEQAQFCAGAENAQRMIERYSAKLDEIEREIEDRGLLQSLAA